MEPEDVIDAILRAVRGETVVAPAMTMKLVDLLQPGRQSKTRENLLGQLTDREREILNHLAQGMSNKAIARSLDISYDTVKLHVRHILSKLNFTSRVEAAVFAAEDICLDSRNSPLIISSESAHNYGTMTICEGGSIKFEANAVMTVQKMVKSTATKCS